MSMSPSLTKGTLAETLKFRTLRWGDYPGLLGWAQDKHKDPCKKKWEAGEPRK